MLLENPKENEVAESILQKLRDVHNSTLEALRGMGVPENLIQTNTAFYPEFGKLLPGEVTDVYQLVKQMTILYFDAQGFSQREISRRLKGESHVAVRKVVKRRKNE